MIKCSGCGRVLNGWCWSKRVYDKREYYCYKCAAEMIDEHTSNHLLLTFVEKEINNDETLHSDDER